MSTKLHLFFFCSDIVDYILYNKLWALQDFFRCPTQCYDEVSWKRFVDVCQTVGFFNNFQR